LFIFCSLLIAVVASDAAAVAAVAAAASVFVVLDFIDGTFICLPSLCKVVR
jgi:hypothetical protein